MAKIRSCYLLIGQKAAGKGVLGEFLELNRGYKSLRISDIIRVSMAADGVPNLTTVEMMEYSNARKKAANDGGLWARKMYERALESGITDLIADGIRNPAEIVALQQLLGDAVSLAGIYSPFMLRAKRAIARKQKGDPCTLEGFAEMDDRDRGVGEPEWGQRVDDCMALVPVANRFNNDGGLDKYYDWISGFVAREEQRLAARPQPRLPEFRGEFGG